MIKIFTPVYLACMASILANCAIIERAAIPKSELLSPELQKVGTQSQISHQAWTSFLQTNTKLGDDGIVRVDYAAVTCLLYTSDAADE